MSDVPPTTDDWRKPETIARGVRQRLCDLVIDLAPENKRLRGEVDRCRALLDAILTADERGQGLPFAEAMEAAHVYLESVRAR